MKKQFKNPIFKFVLLLLSVVLLVVSAVIIATAVNASGSNTRTLVLNFDTVTISSCTIKYEDEQGVQHTEIVTQSGKTFTFVEGAEVIVTVETVNEGLWPVFTCVGQSIHNTGGKSTGWGSFTQNSELTVTCVNREYKLHALDYDGKRDIRDEDVEIYGYVEDGDSGPTIADLTQGEVIYQNGSANRIELPKVSADYHTYNGWYMITGTGESDVYHIALDKDGKCFMPESVTVTSSDGYLYVYPAMIPNEYTVYRVDYVHDKNSPGHEGTKMFVSQKTGVIYNDKYSAIMEEYWSDDPVGGGYKVYPGYQLMTDCTSADCLYKELLVWDTSKDQFRNTVKRYYTPIEYTLTFNLNGKTGESITFDNTTATYLYGSPSGEIAIPSRTGYHFAGWKVEVYKNGQWTSENVPFLTAIQGGENAGKYLLGTQLAGYNENTKTWEDLNAVYASEANENGDYEIRLIAQWDPINISIEYDLGSDVTVSNGSDFATGGKFTVYKYNEGITIDNPVRVGWKLIGWKVTDENGNEIQDNGLSKIDGNRYQIAASFHTQSIKLTAQWERKTYTVVLDGQGAAAGFTDSITDVKYGETITIPDNFVLPQKVGHTFGGYWSAPNGTGTQYVSVKVVDGEIVADQSNEPWIIDDEDGSEVTLYAHWIVNNYNIIIPTIEKIPAGATITIVIIKGGIEEKHSYTQGFQLPYGTEFRVEIAMPSGYKIVEWNGQTVNLNPEATEGNRQPGITFYSANHTVGAAPEGMTLIAKARPAAPNLYTDVTVGATEKDAELKVEFKSHIDSGKYEFAISLEDNITDDTEGVWRRITDGQSYYLFKELPSGEALQAGAYYWVFIRLAATQEADSGVIRKVKVSTDFNELKASIIKQWADMLTNNPDSFTNITITETLTKIENLAITDDLHKQIELIISEAEAELVVSKLKDAKLAELQEFYTKCILSGFFSEANEGRLLELSTTADTQIRGATTEKAVNDFFDPAMAAMKAIPVTYLKNDSMQLESARGLNQGSSITLNSIQDIKALRRAIADAIASGKITADSFITIEAATELLRALDTVGAYNFSIINVQISEGDVFTLTLTIPETLINRKGLQVAYFNQATGMLELLETTREGTTLVFKAKYIADFVILADPEVDLTFVIIALGAILLCQLIAIALVLAARSKAKNSVMHASVALPMFLTIHFLPIANAELIALGLGAAVLVAQIVLMWLLLSSGMIRVFKTKRTAPTAQTVTPAVHENDLQENPYAAFDEEPDEVVDEVIDEVVEEVIDDIVEEFIEEATEEEIEEPVEEILDEDAFDEELAEELANEQNEEYTDEVYAEEEYAEEEYVNEEYAEEAYEEEAYEEEAYEESNEAVAEEVLPEETEEVYEDEEFVEHTPETYYSIDEEENVYAYDEEEAERASDAQETNEAAEETAYDTDPFEGVFGESYEPGGDSSDERGDQGDEEPYDESYEYADAEDASTEDADREETEGQGTVDPYAYVVEDDGEEISDDEEMYRYDE